MIAPALALVTVIVTVAKHCVVVLISSSALSPFPENVVGELLPVFLSLPLFPYYSCDLCVLTETSANSTANHQLWRIWWEQGNPPCDVRFPRSPLHRCSTYNGYVSVVVHTPWQNRQNYDTCETGRPTAGCAHTKHSCTSPHPHTTHGKLRKSYSWEEAFSVASLISARRRREQLCVRLASVVCPHLCKLLFGSQIWQQCMFSDGYSSRGQATTALVAVNVFA